MTVHFGDVNQVRRVIGTKEGDCVVQMMFKRADGSEVARMETYRYTDDYLSTTETVLADGEEIIGVYGYKDDIIYGLGVLIWKPPRK